METKKHGTKLRWEVALGRTDRRRTQRYRCRGCGRTFIDRLIPRQRYTEGLLAESVKRHIEDRSSFRVIAKRLSELTHWRFGRMTAHRALVQAAQACKTPVEVAQELKPRWEGYLHLDGTGMKIKGQTEKEWTAFVAQDSTGDIVHMDLLEGGEQKETLRRFLEVIRDQLHYPVRGIISDLREEILWAVSAVFPSVPHQGCLTHTLRLVDEHTGYKAIRRQLRKELKRWRQCREGTPIFHREGSAYRLKIRQIRQGIAAIKQTHGADLRLRRRSRIWLLSSDPEAEEVRWNRFQRGGASARHLKGRALAPSLKRYRPWLTTHLRHPGMPKTNNRIENLNKQLKRRMKTIEGFGTSQAARNYLHLWSIYLRFKPYTDCRPPHRHRNGKAPLECAGVDLTGLDWLKFAQKSNT